MMTTFDPTADPSGNPATSDEADTEPASTEGDSGSGETGLDDMASTTSPGTTEPAESGETGTPVGEQPESGMYSECATVADCIGQTTCVIVPGAPMGFCSHACADAGTDCTPNPGATSNAAPACVDDGNGMQVCALSCDGGLTCPGGMECASLGASMVCV